MEYRESEEFTADLTKELAPQVRGGNQAVTDSLARALSAIDPQLSAFVVEGLKSPATTQHAVNALLGAINDQSAFTLMSQLAPLTNNAAYYAFKNPSTESDPSLISPQKITEIARTAPNPMATASALLEQGEVASAELVKRLTDYGAKTAADLEKGLAQFKEVLGSLDRVEVSTEGDQGVVAMIVKHPAMPDMPLVEMVGEVDPGGVWRPEVEGFGIGTPAQARLTAILEQGDVRQALRQQFNIQTIEPTVLSLADPKPELRPAQDTLTLEELQADPEFQALSPEDQRGVMEIYFDEHVATDPTISRTVQIDPDSLQEIKKEWMAGSLVERAVEMAKGLFGNTYGAAAAGEMLGATTQAAQLGAAALGAQPSIMTPAQTTAARGAVGEHPVAEFVGRAVMDMALTPALGPVGAPLAMEALRAANEAEQKDLPIYHSVSDTVMSGLRPFTHEPKSQLGAVVSADLRTAIVGKAVAVGLHGAVGLGVGGAALTRWAARRITGATPEGVKEIIKDVPRAAREFFVTGEIPPGQVQKLEALAAANNTTINQEVNRAIVERTPPIFINPTKRNLTVTLKTGQILDENTFPKELKDAIDARVKAEPGWQPQFAESSALAQVAAVEGPIAKVNSFLDATGMGLRVIDGRTAKGLRVTRKGRMWSVASAEFSPPKEFKTAQEVRNFVDNYPAPGNQVEAPVLRELLSKGKNGHYLMAEVVNTDVVLGNLPVTPNWSRIMRRFFSGLQPQTIRMRATEAELGAPLFSRVVLPIERGFRQHTEFTRPYTERINAALKGIGNTASEKRKGYTYLMAEKPGTQNWDDLIAEYKLDPQKGLEIRQIFLDGAKEFGLDGDKLLTQIIPRVRASGSIEAAFPRGSQLPKELTFWAQNIREGTVPFSEGTEHDIEILARSFISQGSWNKHLAQSWREAVEIANQLVHRPVVTDAATTLENAVKMRQQQHTYLEHYLRSVKGFGDQADEDLMWWMGTMFQKLSLGSGIPPHEATRLGKRVYGTLYAANYAAYFGFRPSAIAKQYLQLVQSTFPHFGARATMRGFMSLFGKGGAARRQRIKDAGIALDTPLMGADDVGPLGELLQRTGKGMSDADNFNRFAAASSELDLLNDWVPWYQARAPKVTASLPLPATPMPGPIGPPMPPPIVGPMMPSGIRAGGVAMRPIQRAVAPVATKPPPTITSTTSQRIPKNYGLVSPAFQKQFPLGTEVTFEAVEAGGVRPARGTITGYIRTKSGVEHVTVAEPGVPGGHVINTAMGLRRAGGPGSKPGPKGPRTVPTTEGPLPPPRPAPPAFEEFIRATKKGPAAPKPPALEAMDDAAMEPVIIPNTTPPPFDPPTNSGITDLPGLRGPLWKKFAEETKIDHFDPMVQQQIKTRIDSGDVEEAKNIAMREAVRKTQYLYDMPNRPPALHSVAGRFVGNMATYPLSSVQQFTEIFTGGTRTWQQRTGHATRWFAANATVKTGAKVILGADMANYVFFQPMIVSGGPGFNWWLEWPKIMTGFSHQSALGHAGQGFTMMTPGSGMARDVYRTGQGIAAGDPQRALRGALNIQPTEEERKLEQNSRYRPRPERRQR